MKVQLRQCAQTHPLANLASEETLRPRQPGHNLVVATLIGQGVDMGRPSLLLTRVIKKSGSIVSTHVGGNCVQMMEGVLRV